jgi:hypothetical protein
MANFFPRWTNWIPLKMVVCVIVIACGLTARHGITPRRSTHKVGYQPIQPVPFPHDIHVTQLGWIAGIVTASWKWPRNRTCPTLRHA